MKLSCKVIEDMLPMYYDGVCSDESATLVEEHIRECPQCSRLLSDLHSEIEIPKKPVDDLMPLEGIQRQWKKSKWTYIRRGICITLATLLLVTAVLTGIWYFSYAKYYYQLTRTMERTAKEDQFFTSSDYSSEKNGYRFEVWLPIILSNSGFVRVMDDDGLVMFLYPEAGGSYSFWLSITDQDNEAYSVHLKSDMTPDFENYQFPVRSESEKQKITQLLAYQNEEITSMLEEIQVLWGIDLMQYVP